MDRSRLLSWSLGIALLSAAVGSFTLVAVLPFFAFFFPSMSIGELVFVSYCVMVTVLFSFFALIFRSSLTGSQVPKTSTEVVTRHPTASLVLFLVGLGYGIFVLVSVLSPFIGGGVGWSSSIFAAMLYPLGLVIPAMGTGSAWLVLLIPLYLALPDIVISYFLFRWRARVLALVLALLTTVGVLAFAWFFLLLAAAFG